mmetsp:Transcript_92992/g.300533  ORF Transcript_92992/g.300533 Transcript_92992/m.300533 type:complete len:489 (+) Transcript_92992:51-1517(+)
MMTSSRHLRVAVIGCLLAAGTTLGAAPSPKRRRGEDDSKKTKLPHHSFTTPLEYRSLLDDWVVSGSSLFERDRLLIYPGVPGLAGFAWNKWSMLTNDFEVIFQVRFSGEKDVSKTPDDQSFSFWYIHENMTAVYNETAVIKAESWSAGMQQQGFTFAGGKAKFDGFGTMFSTSGASRKPTMSFIANDGSKELDFKRDVPSVNAKDIDFRNTLNPATVKIRVKPDSIEGFLKQSPSLAWNECFKITPTTPVRAGGFMGFTAWSGSGQVPDLVSITEIEVNNFDDTSIGEEMQDVSAQIQNAYREMLTDEHRHFLDQKSQTEHLSRLVSMLQEHIDTTKPAEEKLIQQVQVLTGRLHKLGEQCRELKQETHLLLGEPHATHNNHAAGVKAMREEIVGLRRIFVKDSATARQKLDSVSKNIQEVKTRQASQSGGGTEKLLQIAKQTETLEKTVWKRGSQMTWMMLILLLAIGGIGFLMWNRMYYYEKKHFI